MGRVKKCIVCDNILFCKECGVRQSPTTQEKTRYTMLFTKEQRQVIKQKAQDQNMTVAAYIRDMLQLGSSEEEKEST